MAALTCLTSFRKIRCHIYFIPGLPFRSYFGTSKAATRYTCSDQPPVKMKHSFSNVSFDSDDNKPVVCESKLGAVVLLSLIDIFPPLFGQPVVAKLLWITFTSKKATDILNFNLALFHNVQYLMCVVHLVVLFVLSGAHMKLLRFMLNYVQIGGPMSLCFICCERYVAVVHPMSYPLLKKYRLREVCAVTVWLLSVSIASASIFSTAGFSTFSEQVVKIVPFSLFLVMTAVIVRSSIHVSRMLKKSSPGRDTLHPVKKRAFTTIRATSAVTVCFYAPVSTMQRFMLESDKFDCILIPLSVFLLSAASVVHPLFYLHAQGKALICLKKRKER